MRLRPVAGGAASLSRRAGAFAMGQRRAYQGNLQDGDRIFTNLYAVTTAMPSATKKAPSPPAHVCRYNDTDWGIQGAMKRGDWCPPPTHPHLHPPTHHHHHYRHRRLPNHFVSTLIAPPTHLARVGTRPRRSSFSAPSRQAPH